MVNNELIKRKNRIQLKNNIVKNIAEDIDKDYLKLESGEFKELKYFDDHLKPLFNIILDDFVTQCFNVYHQTFNESSLVLSSQGLRNITNEIIKKSKALQSVPEEITPELIKTEVDNYIAKYQSQEEYSGLNQDEFYYTPPNLKVITIEYIQKRIEELIDDLSEGNINMKDSYEDHKYRTVISKLVKLKELINPDCL